MGGSQIATGPSYNDGDIIGVALDSGAMTVAFRTSAERGMVRRVRHIRARSPTYRLGVTVYQVGESGTANFGGPFVGTPPSGFVAWG